METAYIHVLVLHTLLYKLRDNNMTELEAEKY